MHRDGFASAGLLKNDKERGKENEGIEEDGKVRVQLDYNGDIIEVSKISTKRYIGVLKRILYK